jgi:hypothetical protein
MVGYEPHEAQMLIHDSAARFKVPCCGRRFGKSTSAIRDFWPDFMERGRTFWLVGPTYELGEREFEVLYDDVMNFPAAIRNRCQISYSPAAGNMKVLFPWRTLVKVVSAEKPKSLLGKGLSGAIMCEAAEHEEITWTKYIRPALADRRGRAIFPSTPKGFNFYYHYHRRGLPGSNTYVREARESTINAAKGAYSAGWESWQFPSWANTHVFSGPDDPEFDEIRANTSQVIWEQEYEAKFTSFEGRVYDEFDERIHVTDLRDVVRKWLPFWKNYWGVDFGFKNPFACLDVMVDPEDNVYVWREYYVSGVPTIIHCDRLRQRDNPPGFHVDCIFADPAGADGVATLQLKLGQVFARKVGWLQGVEQLKVLFRGHKTDDGETIPRIFIDRSCVNLIGELNTLHMVENKKPSSQNSKEQQHTHNDHACDALRYFCNEYFVLGAGTRLSDINKYADQMGKVGDTIFTYDQAPFTMDAEPIRW